MALNDKLKGLLGVQTNVPKIDWCSYKGIIIAPPKFGKTTLGSLIPNSILLAFEQGYDSLQLDKKDIHDWSEFTEFVDALEENIEDIGDAIRLVVFDTAHRAFDMCGQHMLKVCNREKGKRYARLQNVPYAEGLERRDEEFRKQLLRLDALGIKWIMLGHTTTKTINKEGQDPYQVVDHDFEKRLADIIVKDASYMLIGENYIENDEDGNVISKRKFIAKNDGLNQAGGRVFIGEDILFDTEEEFVEKFKNIFTDIVLKKNNIDVSIKEQKLEEEHKDVLDNISKVAKEIKTRDELEKEIKDLVSNLASNKKAQVMNYLMDSYGSKSLKERTIEELQGILQKCSEMK